MKSFKFNMAQVLRMKLWREEAAKKAMAIEVQALEVLKERLRELQEDRSEVLNSGVGTSETEIDYRNRLSIIQYAQFMGSLIEGQEGEIATQGTKLKEKSDLLLKAMQERKVMEKLRDRKADEYKVMRNRFEYGNLDESSAGFLVRNLDRKSAVEGTFEN